MILNHVQVVDQAHDRQQRFQILTEISHSFEISLQFRSTARARIALEVESLQGPGVDHGVPVLVAPDGGLHDQGVIEVLHGLPGGDSESSLRDINTGLLLPVATHEVSTDLSTTGLAALGEDVSWLAANVVVLLPPLEAERTVLVILTGSGTKTILYEGLVTTRDSWDPNWSWTCSSCSSCFSVHVHTCNSEQVIMMAFGWVTFRKFELLSSL